MNPMNNMMNNQIMNNMSFSPIPPNMPFDKLEIINHLMNQNMMLQNQIQMNNDLIQKIIQKEIINSVKNDINLNNSEITYPNFSEYSGLKIFIKFAVSTGYKFCLSVPYNVPISKLLSAFITCHHLSEDLIDTDVIFLYNAIRIKKDDQRTLAEFHLRNDSNITVVDRLNYFKKFVK